MALSPRTGRNQLSPSEADDGSSTPGTHSALDNSEGLVNTLVVLFSESSSVGSKLGTQARRDSQKTGQAGVGSILSLELHRGWAICPLSGRTHMGEPGGPSRKKGQHSPSHLRSWRPSPLCLLPTLYTVMRLCSGRLQASMWSCSSCWEKFWCICAASWASMAFPHALFRSVNGAGVIV